MIKNLINLLFPSICVGCNAILLQNENILCLKCRHEIPFTNHAILQENEIYKKFYGRLSIEQASSLLYYRKKGIVQQVVHNLKYKNHQEIGSLLGNWYLHRFNENPGLKTVTEIIPVPLHKKRFSERGYNQLTVFGKTLADGLHIPYNDSLLFRESYSKTQTQKNIFSRTEINRELFDIVYTERDYGKHFLLIDDVITSGATLEACGQKLLKIPGAKLSIATIAYTDA